MKDSKLIKFNLKMSTALTEDQYIDLEKWRAIFFKMSLIGEYRTEMISFGSLSKKAENDEFYISGAETGNYPHLNGRQYTKVTKCEIAKKSIAAIGPITPSKDSLIHHCVYSSFPEVQAVFLIHSSEIWDYMMQNQLEQISTNPSTSIDELSNELKKIAKTPNSQAIAFEPMKDMVLFFADSCDAAGKLVLSYRKKSLEGSK